MPKWVNIDKRAHTAAQRNLCESCGYGTQLPRAPKKPFSEGLLEAAQKADSFIVLGQDLDHGMNFTAFHLGYAGRGGNGLM